MDPDSHSQDHGNGMHGDVHGGIWVEGGTPYQSHHQSPVHEYNGFAFNPMPMQSVYSQPSMPPPRTTQPQLHPLVTTPWPSMLGNHTQSNYNTPIYNSPPVTTPSVTTPMSAPPMTPARAYVRERRTLTDDQRRKMCMYAEENPHVKQTEIGTMFGVERSTVSKVLRNREKYLSQDDASKNQLKPGRKFPDVERAVANWVKNEKRNGRAVSDDQIFDQFKHFARTVVNSDQQLKGVNNTWLEAFKQKNGLSPKSRKGSTASELDAKPSTERLSPSITPTSPQIKRDASPSRAGISPEEKQPKKMKSESPPVSVTESIHGHRPYASIGGALTDVSAVSFSPETLSPTPSFFTSTNPFTGQQSSSTLQTPITAGYRPRSQTFPIGTSNDTGSYASTPTSSEAHLSGFMISNSGQMYDPTTEAAPAQESFLPTPRSTDDGTTSPAVTTSISSPHLDTSGGISPASPSLDETRRALEVVWSFFQNRHQSLDPQEVAAMGSLMDKLKLQPVHIGGMAGGLHSINEAFAIGRSIAE